MNTSDSQYKIIGVSREFMDANEYVTVPHTNKIQFTAEGVSMSRTIKKECHKLYVHCAQLNTYYVLSFAEYNLAGNKGTSCIVGVLDVDVCEESDAVKHAIRGCECAFVSTDIMELNTLYDKNIKYYNADAETYPLFEFSYDGNDELYPCGYAKIDDAFLCKYIN